jgi:hypothetical protein
VRGGGGGETFGGGNTEASRDQGVVVSQSQGATEVDDLANISARSARHSCQSGPRRERMPAPCSSGATPPAHAMTQASNIPHRKSHGSSAPQGPRCNLQPQTRHEHVEQARQAARCIRRATSATHEAQMRRFLQHTLELIPSSGACGLANIIHGVAKCRLRERLQSEVRSQCSPLTCVTQS